LLVALAQASHDDDERVYSQLPELLCPEDIADRQLRVLIMCPPSLIQNWRREIDRWARNLLGNVVALDSATASTHMQDLEEWMQFGGILLVGYQMFRNRVVKGDRTDSMGDGGKRIREILLQGPEVVVADEAHHLKNQKSGVAVAANNIATHSRIGLTGTPMSNDVQEIYSLVSFAAPGFLGAEVEFKAHYTEPIKDGLYQDSSYYEKRRSLMKLKVLHAEIQPKVHRANIEVLRGSLRPKVEFMLTVPLGDVQRELYSRTVRMLIRGGRTESASTVAIFGWLSVLTLLTNHPYCFRKRLLEPPKTRNDKRMKRKSEMEEDVAIDQDATHADSDAGGLSTAGKTDADSDADPWSEPVGALGFTQDIIQSVLEGFEESMDFNLSAKMGIFFELLGHCLGCNDKVLIFSSNILTLDFLGHLLEANQIKYGGFGRIDGSTPMHIRTSVLEDFHGGQFDVMLVSTKAGGVGLNIQGANRVFIFDFQFNPTHEEQAIGRAYRLGQTKPVFVYRFVTGGTFEENIESKQLFKTQLAQRVVDKKNPKRCAEKNTRDYLYQPKEIPQADLDEWMGKDPFVLDKLLAQHGEGPGKKDTMIRAIKTMETLQEDAMDAPLDDEEQRQVEYEIQVGRNRARGKNAVNGYGFSSTAPQYPQQYVTPSLHAPNGVPTQPGFAGPSSTQRVVKLKTKQGWKPVEGAAEPVSRPPPSTYAGVANASSASRMGGLPYVVDLGDST
jgi:transcriptional regulator ATRX